MITFISLKPVVEANERILNLTASTLFSSEAFIYKVSQSILPTITLANVVLPVPALP